jgi:NAD(P)-dependent dehydrogenase (short-subunit alcohol dehydrogenase family)
MHSAGKVALITGGKRIGAVVATTLAKAGVDIALVYNRSRDEADETSAAVRKLGSRAFSVQGDVTSAEACEHAVASTIRDLGRLDILVNMASRYIAKPFDQLSAEDWDRQLSVDLRASFLFAHAAAPEMKKAGRRPHHQLRRLGCGKRAAAVSGYTPYYVAKGRSESADRGAGARAAPYQILVNAIRARDRSSRRRNVDRKKATPS